MPFTLTMPKLSPTMEEGTITLWHKKEGEKVEAGDLLFEVSTDKATVEYNALDEGWLRKILVGEGISASVNQSVAILTEEETEDYEGYKPEGEQNEHEAKEALLPETKEKEKKSTEVPSIQRVMASPLAKKLAKERNIDLAKIVGTGPAKRIMSRDLDKYPPARDPAGSFAKEALSPIRKVIAQRLQEAKSTIPHFYVQHIVNAESLIGLREQLKNLNVLVSINDCIVKACALALKEHPGINSGFNTQDNSLIRYQTIDIAVAVSIAEGLITPIVAMADEKTLPEISKEIRSLAKRAKDGKLAPHEFQGGSFTISNLGMYGIANFQAIINPPQAAILAVGGVLDAPVLKNGSVVAGKTMQLTLSVDHRVIDGVAAAEFLNSLKKLIENPVSLLLT